MTREEVSVVESNINVQVAAVASCRAARLRTSGAIVLLPWGRITAPTASSVQGTGVSGAGFGTGTRVGHRQDGLMTDPANPTKSINPANSINGTKYDVVVDDAPGVRYWSPPV
jgi:hypothetical protein